jgi:uncharacterized protein (DUF934 family)
MRVIRKRRVVEDHWRHLSDGEPAPPAGDVIVSVSRWGAEKRRLLARSGRVGVLLGAADPLEAVVDDLDRLSLVALEFGSLGEGRGFSQARLLRERHGYPGEVRAIGAVSRDRLAFMERCGIDAFELGRSDDVEEALQGFDEVSWVYQPAADGAEPVARRRHHRGAGSASGSAPRPGASVP